MANFRLLLLDNHLVAIQELKALLRLEPQVTVVAEAVDWWTAVRLASEVEVDVCIMDVSRPGLDGALATRRLRQVNAGIKVIALADDHDLHALERLLSSGINAYILKRKLGTELVPAIDAVMHAGVYLGDAPQSSLGGVREELR